MKLPENIQLNYEHGENWEREAIKDGFMDRVEGLSDSWDFDKENFLNDSIEILVTNGIKAGISQDGMYLSDPDIYRAGMLSEYDKEDEKPVREMVTENYPEPFHELDEETGQLVGRRMTDNWEFNGEFEDGVIDESFGLMAIKEFHPDFLPFYRNVIEENLKIITELNSEDQVYAAKGVCDSELEVDDFHDMNQLADLKENYTRTKLRTPKSFVERVQYTLEETELRGDEVSLEDLKEIREDKIITDSVVWRAQMAAYRLTELFRMEDPISVVEDDSLERLGAAARYLDQEIREEYNIPQ